MADLKDKLVQLGSVILDNEAATAFSNILKAYGKPINIKYGYISKWELAAEFAACIDPAKSTDIFTQSTIKGLIKDINEIIQNPTPTEDNAKELDEVLNELLSTAEYGLFDRSKHPSGENAWSGFLNYKVSWPHPTLKDGSKVYGWPNYPGKDPRQTGKVIVIDYGSDTALIDWMFVNAHTYGFIWYGPTENTFLYVGTTISQSIKDAAVNGMFASRYAFFVAVKGKKPANKEELMTWLKTWEPSADYVYHNTKEVVQMTNAAANENWTAWQLVYNPA